MKVIGIRDFRKRIPVLISENDMVLVTKHGRPTAVLVPLIGKKGTRLAPPSKLIAMLGHLISSHLARSGVSERILLQDFSAWKRKKKSRERPL